MNRGSKHLPMKATLFGNLACNSINMETALLPPGRELLSQKGRTKCFQINTQLLYNAYKSIFCDDDVVENSDAQDLPSLD